MKHFFFLAVCAVVLQSQVACSQEIVLCNGGKSNYEIVLPASPTRIEQKAGEQLKQYFVKVTGADLPVTRGGGTGKNQIHVGNTQASADNKILEGVGTDGFTYATKGKTVFIAGKGEKGTLYGVYGFLEKVLHVNCLAAGVWNIPKSPDVVMNAGRVVENPTFLIRDNYSSIGYDSDYMDWHKINHILKNPASDWGIFDHSFFYLVPPSTYFKQHPEYFSLINNKRTPSQLCLSNDTVLTLVVNDLRRRIKSKPAARYWLVGQQDDSRFCQCNRCQAGYRKYGGVGGYLIYFINEVAEAVPDKTIATFAFLESAKPPVGIKPRSNVMVIYAADKEAHDVSLESEPNKTVAAEIKEWARLTGNNLFVWDYFANYKDVLAPRPGLYVYSTNFRFFKRNGVKYIFAQGITQSGGDGLKQLKSYVLSKLLWNADYDQDSLVQDFCAKYYGAASPYILKYIALLDRNVQKEQQRLLMQADAMKYAQGYLKPEYLQEYNDLLEKAQAAVGNNKDLLDRVRTTRMSVDYMIVKSFQKDRSALAARSVKNNNIDYNAAKERFRQTVKITGTKYLADNNQLPIASFLDAAP